MKPTATQRWVKNRRAGDGAVIPCNWLLHVAIGGESFKKLTKITNAISSIGLSIDGFETMEIRVSMRIKYTFDRCSYGKVQQNLAENLNIICYFLILNESIAIKNPLYI